MHTTLNDWITRDSISFDPASAASTDAAIDRLVASLDSSVELLGFGESLHGDEGILLFRNRLFQRLVEAHGYTAIAIESSFPRGWIVNDYVAGRGANSYEEVAGPGYSHNFGGAPANRELVEWMRRCNAGPARSAPLQFYGFDSPTEMMYADSPRTLLHMVLDYFASIDASAANERRSHIDALLASDADWENTAAAFDPKKSIGGAPAAASLRIETEDLISELAIRRPELIAASDTARYDQATHHAKLARDLLTYHAAMASATEDRTVKLLGIRDAMMADNLAYIVQRERPRGKVLAFAHNFHLKRGRAAWQWGPNLLAWWPAGAHLHYTFGPRYAVIGSAVGVLESQGIGAPEPGSLEGLLVAGPGQARFIPTHLGQNLPAEEIASLPARSGSTKNPGYFPLTPQSVTDFDWLYLG
jgi:erythromycin esterase